MYSCCGEKIDEPETGAADTVAFRPLFICCGVLLLCRTSKLLLLSVCHEAVGYCAGPTKLFRSPPDSTSTPKHHGQSPLSMDHPKEKKRHKSESETHFQLGQLSPAPCCQVLLSNLLSIRNKVDEPQGKCQVWGTYRLVSTVAQWGRQIGEPRYKWAAHFEPTSPQRLEGRTEDSEHVCLSIRATDS